MCGISVGTEAVLGLAHNKNCCYFLEATYEVNVTDIEVCEDTEHQACQQCINNMASIINSNITSITISITVSIAVLGFSQCQAWWETFKVKTVKHELAKSKYVAPFNAESELGSHQHSAVDAWTFRHFTLNWVWRKKGSGSEL